MMSKKEKLNLIIDKVLLEDIPMATMLKPILTNFISQMKEDEVDKMIKIIKAIIAYLEKEENEGTINDEKNKEVYTAAR